MRAVNFREDKSYYEVHNGDRWYTVSMKTPDDPVIMNEQLRPVKSTSALGKRIMKAVNERRELEATRWNTEQTHSPSVTEHR